MKVGGTTFETYIKNLRAVDKDFLKLEPLFPIKIYNIRRQKRMKKHNNIFFKLLICSLALIVVTTTQITAFNQDVNQQEKTKIHPQCIFKRNNDAAITLQTIEISNRNNQIAQIGTDIQLYGSSELEAKNPSITGNGGASLLVAFEGWEDIFIPPNPYFRFTIDGGQSWLPEDSAIFYDLVGAGYDSIKPIVDQSEGNRGFGTILPYGQNDWMTFNFPDISDAEAEDGWLPNGWLASAMMSEWDSVDASGVSRTYAPSVDAYGICAWTGDTLDGTMNGLYYGWEITEGTEFTVYPGEEDIVFDFEADQVNTDIDLSTGMYYQSFYRFNDVSSESLPDGVYIRGVQLDGTDAWADNWTISYHISGAEHPNVCAADGNCYIVYEKDGGIGIVYSQDKGVTFNTATISTTGSSPSISFVEDTILVIYTKNGDIQTATSKDGGASWTDGAPINDESGTVTEGYGTTDVAGMYAAWTDNRLGFNAIFFDRADLPVPIIEIESIAGGFGVSAIVKNTGYATATDIDWSIALEGGAFIGKDTTGSISSLEAGDTATISAGFILGIGATEIKVTAGSASKQAAGTVLLFFVIGVE